MHAKRKRQVGEALGCEGMRRGREAREACLESGGHVELRETPRPPPAPGESARVWAGRACARRDCRAFLRASGLWSCYLRREVAREIVRAGWAGMCGAGHQLAALSRRGSVGRARSAATIDAPSLRALEAQEPSDVAMAIRLQVGVGASPGLELPLQGVEVLLDLPRQVARRADHVRAHQRAHLPHKLLAALRGEIVELS
jgi:hypothetical protein